MFARRGMAASHGGERDWLLGSKGRGLPRNCCFLFCLLLRAAACSNARHRTSIPGVRTLSISTCQILIFVLPTRWQKYSASWPAGSPSRKRFICWAGWLSLFPGSGMLPLVVLDVYLVIVWV